jgi:hypothetical protein
MTLSYLGIVASPAARAAVCANCFAVFVMPDTQLYAGSSPPFDYQPQGGTHIDLLTRYICSNRTSWTEPSTGKSMPILMVTHLGDIVQGSVNDVAWQIASSAFDNLDDCDPPVPYVVGIGNHDLPYGLYHSDASIWNQYFGPDRWLAHGCSDPTDCDWDQGEWFVGAGDAIVANSRNNVDGIVGDPDWRNAPGPPTDQPGRHRVAVIRAPNGQRWLFMGLELSFDFPPRGHRAERDDTAWLKAVMSDYAGVPTVIVHHTLFTYGGVLWTGDYEADSFEAAGGNQGLWDELIEPYPQVVMTVNGHHTPAPGVRENEWTIQTASGYSVHSIYRNYQGDVGAGYGDGGVPSEGDGWNVILVFDPDASEIRVRSYRIDDIDMDGTYDGIPASTLDLDMDYMGRPEVTFSYAFPDTRPESLDNCPGVSNPDQADLDGDGIGDACDSNPVPVLGSLALQLLAGLLNVVVFLHFRPARRFRGSPAAFHCSAAPRGPDRPTERRSW